MKTKLNGFLTLLLAFLVQITFAQEKTVTGKISDANGPLPGVTVIVKGTNTGTQSDFDGNYSIRAAVGAVLQYSFIGMKPIEKTVGSSNTLDVIMQESAQALEEVVVTALGIKKSAKSLPYASQQVKSDELVQAKESNITNALAGKIAGVQIRSQAGSKLGSSGDVRIRGAIGLNDASATYVVDGVIGVSPHDINMDDVESVNVLKGPSATALYGQRGEGGVIIIETKRAKEGTDFKITLNSTLEFDSVDITADYQNEYGGGGSESWSTYKWSSLHPEAWKAFDGARYHDFTDDASWGPKFDGQPFIPWSAFYQGTKYSNQLANYNPQPDNIKDFYDVATNVVNSVNVEKAGDGYNGRLSYTNRNINGIMPGTESNKHQLSVNLESEINSKLTASANVTISNTTFLGDFDDDYSNNAGSGSFNQWFHRDVDINRLRELSGPAAEGRVPTWNLRRNPTENRQADEITIGNYWNNPFINTSYQKNETIRETVYGNVGLNYQITDDLSLKATYTRRAISNNWENKTYKTYELSGAQTGIKNGYGVGKSRTIENNIEFLANYNKTFNDIGMNLYVGGNIRDNYYTTVSASTADGLQVPDFFKLSNTVTANPASSSISNKQVRSLFARASFDYKNYFFIEGTVRNDLSSSLPANDNSYVYPSIGSSFVFSEFTKDFDALSFGKVRVGWAVIGSDIDAYSLSSGFGSANPYDGSNPLLSISNTLIDPNLVVPFNESLEIGTDLRFFHNRLGISYTYFNETKKDEIQSVSISGSSGYSSYLTNAGSFKREGHELTVNATPIQKGDFTWDTTLNWSTVKSTVIDVNEQVDEIASRGYWALFYFTQTAGKEWGQIKGTSFKRINGQKVINADGTYQTESDHYFGSVLPDFVGGWSNQLNYKNFSLSASIDFQKGGLFYSLSSQWGSFSGLYAETAATNDKGNNVRDAVSAGGGVRVDGVDENGNPLTVYRGSQAYYQDFFFNRLTEQNLYDASYIKLREVSLAYRLPKNIVDKLGFINSVAISVYGKNLGLLYKDSNNPHIDPSIISRNFGEYGQQPGTKTFGTSLKVTF